MRAREIVVGAALLAAVAAAAAATACKGGGKRPASGQSAGPTPAHADAGAARATGDPLAFCVMSLQRAALLPPIERAGAILRGCPLCGGGFDAVVALDRAVDGGPVDLPAAWAVIEGCGGVCSGSAASKLREDLADLGRDHPSIGPWRTLAETCPATMHADGDAARFASAAWYALATIGDALAKARPAMDDELRRRLDGALANLVLPLPPRSATGNPLALPMGAAQRATPWLGISIVGDALFLGPLPFARLGTDGFRREAGAIYPGRPVTEDALPAAIDAAIAAGAGFAVPDPPGRVDRPVVLAGKGAPAARVLAVVRAVGDAPTYLAVATAGPASMWPDQLAAHPIAMAARDPVRAPHLRVALASGRIAAVDAGGKVLASAALPSPEQPMTTRLYAAASAMAPGGVVEVVAETGTVAELAGLLDAAVRGGAAGVIPAPPGAIVTGRSQPAFDGAALAALVAPR